MDSSPTKRNRTFDLLKLFGIVYVLFSHFYEPKIFYYPGCSFYVELFFFVSGYTLKLRQQTLFGRLKYITHRTITLLPCYYCYHIFYTIMLPVVTAIVYREYPIPSVLQLPPFNFYEFFIESFVQTSKNRFFEGAWFIPHLWMVQCIFVLIYINPCRSRIVDFLYLVFFFVINITVTYWSGFVFGVRPTKLAERVWHSPLQGSYTNYDVLCFLAIKIGFTLVLIFLGVFYREHMESSNFGKKRLFTIHGFIFSYIMINYFWNIYGNSIFFFLSKVDFATNLIPCYLPIIIILLGIYIFICLSRVAEHAIDEDSFIYRISEKTYAILFQHTLYFFLINLCIAKFVFCTEYALSQVDAYSIPTFRPDLTWPFYIGAALILPTLVSSYGDRLMSRWFTSKTDRPNTKFHQD